MILLDVLRAPSMSLEKAIKDTGRAEQATLESPK